GPHHDADHVLEEGGPLHLAAYEGALAVDLEGADQAHGVLAVAVAGPEGPEVVLAHEGRRRLAHGLGVERGAVVPGGPAPQRRAGDVVPDLVAVALAPGR